MKRVLVAAFALVSLSKVVNAQTGSLLVGGNFGIGSSKSTATPNDIKQNTIVFSPTVGYQFNEQWTAGVVSSIQHGKYTNSSGQTSKSSVLSVGPFIRYSTSLSPIFSLYGQVQGMFGSSKTDGTKTQNSTYVNAFPAIFVNVKNGFGLNFNFGGIEYGAVKPTGSKANTSFSLTFGQSANIGISKNFSLRKK